VRGTTSRVVRCATTDVVWRTTMLAVAAPWVGTLDTDAGHNGVARSDGAAPPPLRPRPDGLGPAAGGGAVTERR